MVARGVDDALPAEEDRVRIGPLELMRLDLVGAIEFLRSTVQQRRVTDVAICNSHTLLTALDEPSYASILQSMTLFNDGVGINWASRYLHGRSFPDNLNGTDFVPILLDQIGIPLRIYLLGAKKAELDLAAASIAKKYPLHTVVGARDGYFSPEQTADVCQVISDAKPDLLLVAMGNPRQERFIHENRAALNVTVAIGVGALFDFMSGRVVRAPRLMRALQLEWLFRLIQEPRRLFQRYVIGIPRFLLAIRRLKKKQ
ncbi:WecB/TagA/CpsF family glycosyltransferase [Roseibium algae]|uniref:WecB/TagA/CpsF family glycosyltransferase n=1 Tax=Roseibium algae TaxID=3123038 RepID=A0ABU8TQ41_9HYPH